jgi:hypothetical protein
MPCLPEYTATRRPYQDQVRPRWRFKHIISTRSQWRWLSVNTEYHGITIGSGSSGGIFREFPLTVDFIPHISTQCSAPQAIYTPHLFHRPKRPSPKRAPRIWEPMRRGSSAGRMRVSARSPRKMGWRPGPPVPPLASSRWCMWYASFSGRNTCSPCA